MKTVEIRTKENSDGANKTVKIAVGQTYIKEVFPCHTKEVLSWNPQRQCRRGRMKQNNEGEQERKKMEEWKRLGKMSRQKLEMETAGFVSWRPHAPKWRNWN
jgi:hypothetical protein